MYSFPTVGGGSAVAGSTPTTAAIPLPHHTMHQPAPQAPGMYGVPPATPGDGQPAAYASVPAPPDWRADHPDLAAAWDAIDRIGQSDLSRGFAAIDLRLSLMKALDVPRKVVDTLCCNDAGSVQRNRIAHRILNFAASEHPDAAMLDRDGQVLTLTDVFSVMDAHFGPLLQAALAPILTLLVLRKAGAANHYDQAVLQQYQQVFTQQARQTSDEIEAQHQSGEGRRNAFLTDAAACQISYRVLNGAPPRSAEHTLPEEVEEALEKVADAYRLNMTLAQKQAVIDPLEQFSGVKAEPSPDAALTLTDLLKWYQAPRPGSAPPPLGQLLSAIIATGWFRFVDEKCQREGGCVPNTLTGHSALPDALCAGLRHYLHGSASPSFPPSPAPVAAAEPAQPPEQAAAGAAWGPDSPYQALRTMLEKEDAMLDPGRFEQMLEQALAQGGVNFVEETRLDPQAAAVFTAVLTDGPLAARERARIEDGMVRLGKISREVIAHANPLWRAYALDLYRTLGAPGTESQWESKLNQVAMRHPELSPRELEARTVQFALGIRTHGYRTLQTETLIAAAHKLVAHWETSRAARSQIEVAHDQSLDKVLSDRVRAAGNKPVHHAPRLGSATAAELLASMQRDRGFTPDMLRKLQRDLTHYYTHANTDERARLDALYRPVLAPRDGTLAPVPMAQAAQQLMRALPSALDGAPPPLSERVGELMKAELSNPATPIQDLLDQLIYYWRGQPAAPVTGTARTLRSALNTLKAEQCFDATGAIDIASTVAFNNAVRENLAIALGARIVGFGPAYATALQAAANVSYAQGQDNMQSMLMRWVDPAAY